MSEPKDVKKVVTLVKTLFNEGKTREEIKKELRKKGASSEILDKIVDFALEREIDENISQFIFSGKNISKIKEILLEEDSWIIRRKNLIYYKTFNLKKAELFVAVFQYGIFQPEILPVTILAEITDDKCDLTLISQLWEAPLFSITKKLAKDFMKICNENNWKFKELRRKNFDFVSDYNLITEKAKYLTN